VVNIRLPYEPLYGKLLGVALHSRIGGMIKLMNDMSFEELIEIKLKIPYKNELFDKIFESLLRRNPDIVIDKFAKSNSFRNADFNIDLLYQIFDMLTDDQWELVLTAFCENDQICGSFYCPRIISSLFRESLERNGFIKPYWFSFREKLDKFSGYEYIDKLKHTIDSHPENS
jgi:hypothetical protein